MTTFGPDNPIDVSISALSPLAQDGAAAARSMLTAFLEAKAGDPSLMNGELSRLGDRIFGGLTIANPEREVLADLVERLAWVGALVAALSQLVLLGLLASRPEASEVVARQLEEVPEELRGEVQAEFMRPERLLSILFPIADEHGMTF